MQNSDNIARIGATNKPIDLDGFMNFTIFKAQTPNILDGEKSGDEIFYKVPADEYLVSKICLKNDEIYKNTSYSAEILMGLKGNATIIAGNTSLSLEQGKSVIIFANTSYEIKGDENDVVYKTSIPLKNE